MRALTGLGGEVAGAERVKVLILGVGFVLRAKVLLGLGGESAAAVREGEVLGRRSGRESVGAEPGGSKPLELNVGEVDGAALGLQGRRSWSATLVSCTWGMKGWCQK